MRRPLSALSILVLLLVLACQPVRGRLRVTFLDVGQGEATVIEGPTGTVTVIDGGGVPGTDERLGGDPGSRVVVPFLRARGISTVDWIVPTHPDDDHVQGLLAVVTRLRVRAALDGGFPDGDGPCRRLRAHLARQRIPVTRARRGQRLALGGGAALEILHPRDPFLTGTHSDPNANSIVARLTYGRITLLLTGDAEESAEADLLAAGVPLKADVLKLGHHGSRGSTSAAFLKAVAPSVAVVSCGRNNAFGHPHRQTLERLAAQRVPLWRTDRQGAITIESDGARLWITSVLP
jgi:competence protein ComEC